MADNKFVEGGKKIISGLGRGLERGARRFAAGVGGTLGPDFEERSGIPGSGAMTIEELKLLLAQKEDAEERPLKLEKLKSETEAARALSRFRINRSIGVGSGDTQKQVRRRWLEKLTTGPTGEETKALDPEFYQQAIGELSVLQKELGPDIPKPQPTSPAGYTTIRKDTKGNTWGLNKRTNKWEQVK